MHAATIELLVNKAHLEPDTAVAFAEAMDMTLASAQLVTIPVLDARFATSEVKVDARFAVLEAKINEMRAELDAKLEKCKADLVRWVFLAMLGNVALSAGATAILNAIQHGH